MQALRAQAGSQAHLGPQAHSGPQPHCLLRAAAWQPQLAAPRAGAVLHEQALGPQEHATSVGLVSFFMGSPGCGAAGARRLVVLM
jgi:hypothetical protein